MKLIQTTAIFTSLVLHQGHASNDKGPLHGITANDVGDVHNKIMMQVNDRMADEYPTDYVSFSEMVLEEVLSLCQLDDDECIKSIHSSSKGSRERVLELQITGENFDINSVLPDVFDDEIREHLQNIHDAIYHVRDSDVDDVIGVINGISDSVKNSDGNEMMKAVVMSAASVAAGSTKYWMSAREDPDNSFRKLHEDNRRVLEEAGVPDKSLLGLLVEPAGVIIADFIGAVVGSVDPAVEWVLAGGLASPLPIIFGSIFTSIFDSIEATGIILPSVPIIVRCFLENLLTDANCTVKDLFCNETDIC